MSQQREVVLDSLTEATARLVRGIDGLSDAQFTEPSGLPAWSRAHVVAHVTLNAEGLARVLEGIVEGHDVAMYDSNEQRDADIETLALVDPSTLRSRFLASTTRFLDAVVAVPAGGWAGEFRRTTSGGQVFPRIAIPTMREAEVEIHHADLLIGYTAADWPDDFAQRTLERVVADRAAGPPFVVRTPAFDAAIGAGGAPIVTGSLAAVTWWMLGRGDGEGLSADPALPTLGPWR